MFTGISRLLKFLRKSFQIQYESSANSSSNQDEHEFQTAVINGIGDFAEKLPDFQMMEIMQFIITSLATLNQGYEETTNNSRDATLQLQLLLLQTVKKVRLLKYITFSSYILYLSLSNSLGKLFQISVSFSKCFALVFD